MRAAVTTANGGNLTHHENSPRRLRRRSFTNRHSPFWLLFLDLLTMKHGTSHKLDVATLQNLRNTYVNLDYCSLAIRQNAIYWRLVLAII